MREPKEACLKQATSQQSHEPYHWVLAVGDFMMEQVKKLVL